MGQQRLIRILFSVSLFAIAMGYLESAVVVYIREIYYPEGFAFPLKIMEPDIAITEIIREFATMVMLAIIGIIAGRSNIERFGLFIFAFGLWDIAYYVFLYFLVSWPESLLTWDILFLIPIAWIGPVIAPVINSITMILLGGLVSWFQQQGKNANLKSLEWVMLITGSLIVIFAYIQDYSRFMLQQFSLMEFIFPGNPAEVINHATTYIPAIFNWFLFIAGEVIFLITILHYFFRLKKKGSRVLFY